MGSDTSRQIILLVTPSRQVQGPFCLHFSWYRWPFLRDKLAHLIPRCRMRRALHPRLVFLFKERYLPTGLDSIFTDPIILDIFVKFFYSGSGYRPSLLM